MWRAPPDYLALKTGYYTIIVQYNTINVDSCSLQIDTLYIFMFLSHDVDGYQPALNII